jgi:dienelactone hydrolase
VAASLCKTARALDPDARLLIAQSGADLPGRAAGFAAFVEQCVLAGVDMDGVSVSVSPTCDWETAGGIWSAVKWLAEKAKPVLVKGVPARDGGASLARCFAMSGVMGVVLSDSSDMSDEQSTPPACLTTDAEGLARFEGTFGDYELVMGGHLWHAPLHPNTPATVEFRKPPTVEPPEAFVNPFVASTEAEVRAWQKDIRARLLEIVGAQNPRQERPLEIEEGEDVDHGTYVARDLRFTGNEGQHIETTLTVPSGTGPFPAVVCLHGHGGDRFMVHDPESNYGGLAVPFAQRGFVTIAPTLEHREYAPNHLWNLMRVVDVLETLHSVDPDRIGVAGLSMGGEWTMWLAATDLRLQAAVVSGWMCTTEGVLSVHNCPCWMPPGLHDLCDIADVHILIAPRPLLFESAVGDGCFPIRCTREGYWRILRGYTLLGVPFNVRQHTFPGGHAWNGGVAYDFMERALKDEAAICPGPR